MRVFEELDVSIVRWSWLVWACLLVATGCGGGNDGQTKEDSPEAGESPFQISLAPGPSPGADEGPPRPAVRCARFSDVHEEAHLAHVYVNGERGRCLMVETIGAGAGWLVVFSLFSIISAPGLL